MYRVQLTVGFLKDLKKIDIKQVELLLLRLKKDLDNSDNPRLKGKALKGKLKGFWRYRYGNYRVIVEIGDTELIVLAFEE